MANLEGIVFGYQKKSTGKELEMLQWFISAVLKYFDAWIILTGEIKQQSETRVEVAKLLDLQACGYSVQLEYGRPE